MVSEVAPRVIDTPTMYTIEHPNGTHLDIVSDLNLGNHSFTPSAIVKFHHDDPSRVTFVAARLLAAGEPVTFDYTTTETSMATPFVDDATGMLVTGHSPQ